MRFLTRLSNLWLVLAICLVTMNAIGQTTVGPQMGKNPPAVSQVTFTYAVALEPNQTKITVTPISSSGQALPQVPMLVYLSDSASGAGVTATASSGTWGLSVSGGKGSIIGVTAATPNVATTRVPIQVLSDSTGSVVAGIIDSAKTRYYPVVVLPDGRRFVGPRLATANYL